jgi:cytochrome c5
MRNKHLCSFALLLTSLFAVELLTQRSGTAATKVAATASGAKQAAQADEENEGQRVFEQRCSSCHNAPEGFSPRISGTIVRHMRVRASLSKREEEVLLRFFNP